MVLIVITITVKKMATAIGFMNGDIFGAFNQVEQQSSANPNNNDSSNWAQLYKPLKKSKNQTSMGSSPSTVVLHQS